MGWSSSLSVTESLRLRAVGTEDDFGDLRPKPLSRVELLSGQHLRFPGAPTSRPTLLHWKTLRTNRHRPHLRVGRNRLSPLLPRPAFPRRPRRVRDNSIWSNALAPALAVVTCQKWLLRGESKGNEGHLLLSYLHSAARSSALSSSCVGAEDVAPRRHTFDSRFALTIRADTRSGLIADLGADSPRLRIGCRATVDRNDTSRDLPRLNVAHCKSGLHFFASAQAYHLRLVRLDHSGIVEGSILTAQFLPDRRVHAIRRHRPG